MSDNRNFDLLGNNITPFSAEAEQSILGSVLIAPETRSSSPVRMLRDETLNSVSCKGLYPCGEGAGYAGGIMSAAVDGMKCAEAIIDAENRG